MVRGTTPTHEFNKLPVLSIDIDQIWISYLQNGAPVFTKEKEDIFLQDNEDGETCKATLKLSQEDTLQFKPGQVNIQIRLLLIDGTALASDEVTLTVKRIIKNGKIE